MGRWAAGDGDIRRTSVDDQERRQEQRLDRHLRRSTTRPRGLRLASYRLRLTLYRTPGTRLTPTVWRLGAMASDIPDRFTVPASDARPRPGAAGPALLAGDPHGPVPRVRQRRRGLVQPHLLADDHRVLGPQAHRRGPRLGRPGLRRPAGLPRGPLHLRLPVRRAAATGPSTPPTPPPTRTCRAWSPGCGSLTDLETLIAAGIPAITSQSFLKDGADRGGLRHLRAT